MEVKRREGRPGATSPLSRASVHGNEANREARTRDKERLAGAPESRSGKTQQVWMAEDAPLDG